MDREYGERYRALYEGHWWWHARTEYVMDTVRRYRPATGWTTILDVGCGDGLFFSRLAEFGNVEGVEPCRELVRSDNPNRTRIHIRPFDEYFNPGKKYSLILMLDVLEHLEHPAAALKHAIHLLEPDGVFIATVPAFMTLWTNHDLLNHHYIRYTRSSFRSVARQSGLKVQEERYLYHWTFPVKMGVRLAETTLRLKPRPPAIPKAWVNQLLYGLSRLEQKTLSRLPVPFGSSLMVVGTRSQ